MSQFVKGFSKTLVAGSDLSSKKYLVAKLDSSGNADVATAATDAIIGVIEEGCLGNGSPVSVQILGTAKVIAGGTITPGAWVTATTGGKVIATTTDHNTVLGRYIGGVNSADGDVIEVQIGVFTLSA